MITRPLDLQARLAPTPRDQDFFAWINVGLIVLFFGLLGSRFILAPGLPVGVGGDDSVDLPRMGGATDVASPASVVVSYRRDNVILFEGGKYTLEELRKPMESYARAHPGSVLLVRADRQVSMQAFLDLCEMARRAGFSNVLAAADRPPSSGP